MPEDHARQATSPLIIWRHRPLIASTADLQPRLDLQCATGHSVGTSHGEGGAMTPRYSREQLVAPVMSSTAPAASRWTWTDFWRTSSKCAGPLTTGRSPAG